MKESNELVGIIMAIAFGTFTILASIFNWDFFFNDRKAKFMVRIFGRNGSRIFYALIGLALYFFAYKMYTT